nr:immunoglobulin heavy chain junction region [Macaca mulatta]MOW86628.1 immunoglobulin heavy chain junction region [Macaca mulatta]MOW86645.1 immunoglobulin heavy chain junction region [Macaca mulatta]MOW86668.1 immunoglobulin heavy chain junction region [Macaca mulatta]MOW86713.1 immunoglobulin heavy chain junction region [Macaca mulatta]
CARDAYGSGFDYW